MEKEHQPDSMATITMKPEYPPSEVYSASEPPPVWTYLLPIFFTLLYYSNCRLYFNHGLKNLNLLTPRWVSTYLGVKRFRFRHLPYLPTYLTYLFRLPRYQ